MVCPCSVPRAGKRLPPPKGLADARVDARLHEDTAAAALVSGEGGKLTAGADAEDVSLAGAGGGAASCVVEAVLAADAGGADTGVELARVCGNGPLAIGLP